MSQLVVEALLGRLVTDEEFRRRFYQEPIAICAHDSLEVTSRELRALCALDRSVLEQVARHLDPRIVRAVVRPQDRSEPRQRSATARGAK